MRKTASTKTMEATPSIRPLSTWMPDTTRKADVMPDSITNIAASTTPASNLAFRSSLSASRRMASPSSVLVWYRVCGHGGK